jgi:hypothetical protein
MGHSKAPKREVKKAKELAVLAPRKGTSTDRHEPQLEPAKRNTASRGGDEQTTCSPQLTRTATKGGASVG